MEISIEKKYQHVVSQIDIAAKSANRSMGEIQVIAVCKRQSAEKIREGISAGIKLLGENYPEDVIAKKELLGNLEAEWHMIGHIQSRKMKIVAEQFQFVHSIDSLITARKLNVVLQEFKKIMPILLELNISGEASKHGFHINTKEDLAELDAAMDIITELQWVIPSGLMVMPPYTENPEASRKYFIKARRILDQIQQQYPTFPFRHLSMGTSQDFLVAVQEGATMVRIGTSIFGER